MAAPVGSDDLDRMPVGAGPYRVVEHTEGSRIVMERFEEHWDTAAGGPDRIEFSIIPTPARGRTPCAPGRST